MVVWAAVAPLSSASVWPPPRLEASVTARREERREEEEEKEEEEDAEEKAK